MFRFDPQNRLFIQQLGGLLTYANATNLHEWDSQRYGVYGAAQLTVRRIISAQFGHEVNGDAIAQNVDLSECTGETDYARAVELAVSECLKTVKRPILMSENPQA